MGSGSRSDRVRPVSYVAEGIACVGCFVIAVVVVGGGGGVGEEVVAEVIVDWWVAGSGGLSGKVRSVR